MRNSLQVLKVRQKRSKPLNFDFLLDNVFIRILILRRRRIRGNLYPFPFSPPPQSLFSPRTRLRFPRALPRHLLLPIVVMAISRNFAHIHSLLRPLASDPKAGQSPVYSLSQLFMKTSKTITFEPTYWSAY
jgi:hypothetical protein